MKKYLALFFFTAIIACGCNPWHTSSSKPLEYTRAAIWETSNQVIRARYLIESASEKEGEIETDWNTQLSSMYKNGYRERAYVTLEEYKGNVEEEETELEEPILSEKEEELLGEEYQQAKLERKAAKKEKKGPFFVIKIRVERERNENMIAPDLEQAAIWVPEGNDVGKEMHLINVIANKLALRYRLANK